MASVYQTLSPCTTPSAVHFCIQPVRRLFSAEVGKQEIEPNDSEKNPRDGGDVEAEHDDGRIAEKGT